MRGQQRCHGEDQTGHQRGLEPASGHILLHLPNIHIYPSQYDRHSSASLPLAELLPLYQATIQQSNCDPFPYSPKSPRHQTNPSLIVNKRLPRPMHTENISKIHPQSETPPLLFLSAHGHCFPRTKGHIHRELPQLMSHHILRNGHRVVDFPIIYLKGQSDKIGEDGCGAGLCADGWGVGALSGTDDGETMGALRVSDCLALPRIPPQ